MSATLAVALAAAVGEGVIAPAVEHRFLHDGTATRGLLGRADAVALPRTTEEVAAVVAWCAERGVPVVPRGGGTGYAGGAVPDGGVVLALERMARIRSLDAEWWRMEAEAGVTTLAVQRRARESGLFFPPDPGAGEQSQIGGNVATNAGGPHAFKYGVTGRFVNGLELVDGRGDVHLLGGAMRKDVQGLDLRSLVVGSEGVLGVITRVLLRLVPAPEVALPVVGVLPDTRSGCDAIAAALASGAVPATVEYLDRGALAVAGGTFPGGLPDDAGFLVICEADGSREAAQADRAALAAALADAGADVRGPERREDVAELWRWRDTVSHAVAARRGGKIAEDVAVPLDRLAEIIEETVAIGARRGVDAVSWGHAGDGNIHANFLCALDDPAAVAAAEAAADDVARAAHALGGTISGEHGVGRLKLAHRAALEDPRRLAIERAIAAALDPRGIMNPGVKLPRAR